MQPIADNPLTHSGPGLLKSFAALGFRLGSVLLLSVFAPGSFLGACNQTSQAQSRGYCKPLANSSQCDGQMSIITVNQPEMILQHPILGMPDEKQSYWDSLLGQIIVLERDAGPIDCSGAVVLTGVWRSQVGPCDPQARGRNQYCGKAIELHSFECQ